MDKRYQVFVSSTYVDLNAERSEVIQALLELKCMPAGMELFPAANDTQWNWIKKVIDESDYYLVIVGGRYGTTSTDTGKSYTQMEYEYALETKKPILAFVHEDISKLPSGVVEQTDMSRRKLEEFRQLVKSRLCKFYNGPVDLGAKVSRSITQLKEQYPATGWIRADAIPSSATLDEVLKLKEENERLKERIYRLGLQSPEASHGLASGSEKFEVKFTFDRFAKINEVGAWKRVAVETSSTPISWDEIFATVGPGMFNPTDRWTIYHSMNSKIEELTRSRLVAQFPKERFRNFAISRASSEAIQFQLRALKLIATNERGEWQMTPYGDNYLAKLLAVPSGRLEQASATVQRLENAVDDRQIGK